MAGLTPSEVTSSCDQLPFIVSQNPYSRANAAKTQNPAGIPRPAAGRVPGCALGCALGCPPGCALGCVAGCVAGWGGPWPRGSRTLTPIRPASRQAASNGRPIQNPTPLNAATNTGARAVPRPSSALRTRTDLSTAAGCSVAASVLSAGTESPNPAPRHAVASSSSANAAACLCTTSQLAISRIIEARSAARPASSSSFSPARRARLGHSRPAPSSEATIAVVICGTKMTPYCVPDRSYELRLVKIVLAAGKVTSAMPWTRPAALTTAPCAPTARALRAPRAPRVPRVP
jgi:hypothetical protein